MKYQPNNLTLFSFCNLTTACLAHYCLGTSGILKHVIYGDLGLTLTTIIAKVEHKTIEIIL
jgi:hypothetical protein